MIEVVIIKFMENDKVIVWEMVLELGECIGVYIYYYDYII